MFYIYFRPAPKMGKTVFGVGQRKKLNNLSFSSFLAFEQAPQTFFNVCPLLVTVNIFSAKLKSNNSM